MVQEKINTLGIDHYSVVLLKDKEGNKVLTVFEKPGITPARYSILLTLINLQLKIQMENQLYTRKRNNMRKFVCFLFLFFSGFLVVAQDTIVLDRVYLWEPESDVLMSSAENFVNDLCLKITNYENNGKKSRSKLC